MIDHLLQADVQSYVRLHEHDNVTSLALKKEQVGRVDFKLVLDQITGRQKARTKLPEWYDKEGILYPPKISMEQCSSEKAATYKQGLVSGATLIDLTGGAGVDTYYLSKNFHTTHYLERDPWLYKLAKHNHSLFKASIEHHQGEAEEFINSYTGKADVIYIDPARRDANNKKIFRLEDCEPDVTMLMELLLLKANSLLIKTSPLLDIRQALSDLKKPAMVHVISVNNDCKEVLYLISTISDERIHTVNLISNQAVQRFLFNTEEERELDAPLGAPARYLYEPNASIMKAGAFRSVAHRYGLSKLHANTHLYTSDEWVSEFPGRKFEIKAVSSVNKKEVRKIIPDLRANVAIRNFPDKVEGLKKKLNLKDGGEIYLFAVRDMKGAKKLIYTKKANDQRPCKNG